MRIQTTYINSQQKNTMLLVLTFGNIVNKHKKNKIRMRESNNNKNDSTKNK